MMKSTYLLTPWGELYYELVYDINQRSAQRWNKPWYPHTDEQEWDTEVKNVCSVSKHPDLRSCPSC